MHSWIRQVYLRRGELNTRLALSATARMLVPQVSARRDNRCTAPTACPKIENRARFKTRLRPFAIIYLRFSTQSATVPLFADQSGKASFCAHSKYHAWFHVSRRCRRFCRTANANPRNYQGPELQNRRRQLGLFARLAGESGCLPVD